MKRNLIFLFTLFLSLNFTLLPAQNTDTLKKWGIETDLVQPFIPTVNIISIKSTRTIAGDLNKAHGDFIVGAFIRPNIKHDVVDRIEEYMLTLGYRQYFIRGLYAEVQ